MIIKESPVSNTLPIVLGIDQGYGNMKTANTVFPTGIIHHPEMPPYKEDLLIFKNTYHSVGVGHKAYCPDKTQDEDFYLLTLAAIGKELDFRNNKDAKLILAIGLPMTWAGTQRKSFVEYLKKDNPVTFTFNGISHTIEIAEIDVYPQGYAAIAPYISDFTGSYMLCDIGNGTMSAMYIEDCHPDLRKSFTEPFGTQQCMIQARELLMRRHQKSIPDRLITEVFRNGKADIREEYQETIREAARNYVDAIMDHLREYGYDPEMMYLHVVGGGGCLIRNFVDYNPDRVAINDDICATAKGYEWLTQMRMDDSGSASA